MTITITVQRAAGDRLEIPLKQGEVAFLVGPNGSGKSSLIYQLSRSTSAKVKRITAHRQTWLASSASTLSADSRKTQEGHLSNSEKNPTSRWKEDFAGYKPNIALYDLVDAENVRARKIAAAFDSDDDARAKTAAQDPAPVNVINEIFDQSNLEVSIEIGSGGEVVAKDRSGATFGVAEMSDGERNALLIAADVLTSEPESLLLIDEPERHLHRSIVAPLLRSLFNVKKDCYFVVSTHDLDLLDHDECAARILVRKAQFQGKVPVSWDIDQLPDNLPIDEQTRAAILGSRRNVLFVEGDDSSLDVLLYSIIFPKVSVVPLGSCSDVERSVKGIRQIPALHWMSAFGVIDHDGRPAQERDALRANGIFSLPVHSVESVYFNFAVQKFVADRMSRASGIDSENSLIASKERLLHHVEQHAERLAAQITNRRIRNMVERARPTLQDTTDGRMISLSIDSGAERTQDLTALRDRISRGDINELVGLYPIRETGAIRSMAQALGFQNEQHYQRAVRQALKDDAEALRFVRSLFDGLHDSIATGT